VPKTTETVAFVH